MIRTPAANTSAYTVPTGTSIAYCWNWDQYDVTKNGFNIVQFSNADGDPQILDTGLANPQLVIFHSSGSNNVNMMHLLATW